MTKVDNYFYKQIEKPNSFNCRFEKANAIQLPLQCLGIDDRCNAYCCRYNDICSADIYCREMSTIVGRCVQMALAFQVVYRRKMSTIVGML